MKKTLTIFSIFLVSVLTLGIIVIRMFFTAEDAWICVNGTWVRHGNPSALKPLSGCGAVHISPTSAAKVMKWDKGVELFQQCKVKSIADNKTTVTLYLTDNSTQTVENPDWATVLNNSLSASSKCGSVINVL